MNETILFVDDDRALRDLFTRQLASELEVEVAGSAEEGLELIERRGSFPVVVSDYDLPGMIGSEFLRRVREIEPHVVTILLTGVIDLDVAIEALHAGRIFRFLEKPCPRERLLDSLRAALEESRRLKAERKRAEQLSFSSEMLTQFNDSLEHRIADQTASLLRLHRFVVDLNSCDSLDEVATLTAESTRKMCGERGVLVELWNGTKFGDRCNAQAGPELSVRRHVQPISTQEGQLGSLILDAEDSHGERLSGLERSTLASVASSVAVAAHNQVRRRERDEAQHATILALAKLAEHRDNETGKHLERVSLYSTLIAEGLRDDGWYTDEITDAFLLNLRRSAPLHDIGKVGIPDAILLKPGKLNVQEWEIMKTHTLIGADTLRSVIAQNQSQLFLEMSLDISWSHHEKWDGTGYPRGIAGEEIPLAARIVALADVYDALTSERPYKHAWSHQRSIEWIRSGAGTHFAPRLVQAFVNRQERADEIRERLADTLQDLRKIGLAVG